MVTHVSSGAWAHGAHGNHVDPRLNADGKCSLGESTLTGALDTSVMIPYLMRIIRWLKPPA